MTANKDLGRRLSDLYNAEAAPRAPDWLLEQALEIIDTTPQRRMVIRVPWKLPKSITFSNAAVAAAVVIAVSALGLAVLGPQTDRAGSPPATSSPSPSPSAPTTLTETFESPRHGISVSHPIGWMVQPATDPWTSDVPQQMSPFADVICSWGGRSVPARSTCDESPVNVFVALASQPLGGASGDEWIADQLARDAPCRSTAPIAIDGAVGAIASHCFEGQVAVVTLNDRGYLIYLYGSNDVAWFKDIVATVELHPEDAVDGAPSTSP